MREVLSSVKIAVLAPCIKLSISGGGGEPVQAGSPEQVDLARIGKMLEESVLSKWSKVSLLDDATKLEHSGAHAIFPELKETMSHVQREVRERLMAMMEGGGANEHQS